MIRLPAIFFLIAALAAQAQQPASEKPSTEQYHFLFVVDTSVSMAPRKSVSIQMMRELIASGFVGQARNGDSIDIWLYDQENDISRFPPQIWEESDSKRIADTAARFIEQLQFKGRSRFAAVARDLDALLPNTKKLLVVILTDGEEPLSGISPDLEINEYVAKLKKAIVPKHPFLISLAALHGRFDHWAVYNGDGRDDLAALPPRPKPKPLLAQSAPRPPQKKADAAKNTDKKPDKKPEDKPIAWELPPGARIANPAPTPQTRVAAPAQSSVAQIVSSNRQASGIESRTTNAIAGTLSRSSNAPSDKSRVVPDGTAEPVASTVPKLSQNVSGAARSSSPQPATNSSTQAKPGPAQPGAAHLPQVATNAVKAVARLSNPKTNLLTQAVAVNQASQRPKTTDAPAPNSKAAAQKALDATGPALAPSPISTAVLFASLAVTGFAIIVLGALLFLKKAKARQDGSIISQSLLR